MLNFMGAAIVIVGLVGATLWVLSTFFGLEYKVFLKKLKNPEFAVAAGVLLVVAVVAQQLSSKLFFE